MNRAPPPADLFARLAAPALERGPVVGPAHGLRVETWLRDGEPAVAVFAAGDADDLDALRAVAWSLGCTMALAPLRGRVVVLPAEPPSAGPATPRDPGPGRIDAVPPQVPGVAREIVRIAGAWRDRLLRQRLADHRDWTEDELVLAVEAPIAGALLGPGDDPDAARVRAALETAGVAIGVVPAGLLALAWDLHLARGVRLAGGYATVGERPPADREGPPRAVLRRFAAWALAPAAPGGRVLVPACGAGRLLLAVGERAAGFPLHLYALDPDPRAVLFASALVAREFGGRVDCTVRAGHPLISAEIFDDPLARLVPADARARLRAVDWAALFPGVEGFDAVLVADPAVPLTRRAAVGRYVRERYVTAGAGTDPALLVAEAGARRLAAGGRVAMLYPIPTYRAPSAAAFRRWLSLRVDALAGLDGYCAARAAAEPLDSPILAGRASPRSLPRPALRAATWTVTDPARAALEARLEAGAAPLGGILLGGVRSADPVTIAPGLVVGAVERRRLVRADRRADRAIRPVIGPGDVERFGSARAAARFAVGGPLPPRARRVASELGLEPPARDPFPPPAGPRLLFAIGAPVPAFLFDPGGRALPLAGTGTVAPADPLLAGLLQSALLAPLVARRCPAGLSSSCLARLPVRLPDPYVDRERELGREIAALARERIALAGRTGPGDDVRRHALEGRIDRAVERLYGNPSP